MVIEMSVCETLISQIHDVDDLFREECIFTIDPETARDLDDAVSCERAGEGFYRVGVHIADVAFFVPEGTLLDQEARTRATSVYMVQKVFVIPYLSSHFRVPRSEGNYWNWSEWYKGM